MRKIKLDLAVSLDMMIEGPNGEIDWCIMDSDMNFEDFIDSIDTILFGRISYELYKAFEIEHMYDAEISKQFNELNQKKHIVFSNTYKTNDSNVVVSSNILNTIKKLKDTPGKDIWLYGGSVIVSEMLKLNLIDELRLSIHPIILGQGKPLFHPCDVRKLFHLVEVIRFRSGVIQVIYQKKEA